MAGESIQGTELPLLIASLNKTAKWFEELSFGGGSPEHKALAAEAERWSRLASALPALLEAGKDAERLDWLDNITRERHVPRFSTWGAAGIDLDCYPRDGHTIRGNGKSVRQAIDAARSQVSAPEPASENPDA